MSSLNHDTVEFQYWIRAAPTRSQPPRSHPVRLSIVNEDTDLAMEESVYGFPGCRTALDYERTKIGVRWIRDGVEVGDQELQGVDLSNPEKLIEHVTKTHARIILQKIASETEGMTFWENEELFFNLIDSNRQIRISVDLLTGRILLTEASNTSAMLLPQTLQNAQHNLSASIFPPIPPAPGQPLRRSPTAKEYISLARLLLLKSHISTLAEYKGWTSQRYGSGYVSKADLDTFLPQQWTWDDLLFLSLANETIVIHVLTKQSWLVDLKSLGNGGALRVVWVEKMATVGSTNNKANWLGWLEAIRFYVRGRYAIYEFEKGLEMRKVEYNVIPPPTTVDTTFSSTIPLPLLSLKSNNLIPEHSSYWASENIILRVATGVDHVIAVWEGRVRHSPEVQQLLSSVTAKDPLSYDVTTKIFRLQFPLSEESTPDIIVGLLVERFLSIERILQLVRQTKAVQTRFSKDDVFRLERFNLSGVECSYGVDGLDGKLWYVQILVGNKSDVMFRHDDPHERFKAFIAGWYNASGGGIGVLAEVHVF